jgi:hypothetical protein
MALSAMTKEACAVALLKKAATISSPAAAAMSRAYRVAGSSQ